MRSASLVSLLARRRNLSAVRDLAEKEDTPLDPTLIAELDGVERSSVGDFGVMLRRSAPDRDRCRSLVVRYLVNGRDGRRPGGRLASVVRREGVRLKDSLLCALAETVEARDELAQHDSAKAIARLESCLDLVRSSSDDEPLSSFVQCRALHWRGWGHSGDFRAAGRDLKAAIDIAEANDFSMRWSYRAVYGALLAASGQYREAIRQLCDEQLLSGARGDNDLETATYCHLIGACAAIDLGVASKASVELARAQDLIEAHTPRLQHYHGHLILFSARLDGLWGNRDEAIHLFEYAIEIFEAQPPSHGSLVLDAKFELLKYAAEFRRYEVVFDSLRALLGEADERGCTHVRTRILAFQASLLQDEHAPRSELRSAYDNLLSRAHMMNNPRLTFLAYADLYAYARKHMDRADQAFWLARLKGLRSVLDRSCYEDLYRGYVTERYRHEIESDLRDLEWDDED